MHSRYSTTGPASGGGVNDYLHSPEQLALVAALAAAGSAQCPHSATDGPAPPNLPVVKYLVIK